MALVLHQRTPLPIRQMLKGRVKIMEKNPRYNGMAGNAVHDLLAACWEIEDGNGGWPGADVVDLVTQMFDGLGFDITHPAGQDGGTADETDYTREMLNAFARGEGVHPEPACDCSDLVPGALLGWNDRDEVQACSDCRRFDTDQEAAEAVAAKIGEIGGRASYVGSYWTVTAGDLLILSGERGAGEPVFRFRKD